MFLRNLLQGEKNELYNREMHVSGMFNSETAHDPINDPINEPINLSDREQKIIELMRSKPGITRIKIAESLGCSESTVKRALQDMVAKNMIKRIGSNKKGEWIIMV